MRPLVEDHHGTQRSHGCQKLTPNGKVTVANIPGSSNPADTGTKHLDESSIQKVLETCHCYIREGRSGIALRVRKSKKSRDRILMFSVWTRKLMETQSESDTFEDW